MLEVKTDGPVMTVLLDRPEVRNAFNAELIARLSDVFAGIGPGVRAVVVKGQGKAFCAGGDLEWMRQAARYSFEENHRDALKLGRLFELVMECPALVIAQVHGAAFGGGCGLVAGADVAVAEAGTMFSFSEVRLGLVPATISLVVLPKIGSGNARRYFATGESFDAAEALRIGLVHEVVPQDGLDAAVERKVAAVLRCGPEAVAKAKRLCLSPPSDMASAARMLAEVRQGAEAQEGIAAFLAKRPARFVEER
jgi:enoyl-CoA hydratase/carnithine racemase